MIDHCTTVLFQKLKSVVIEAYSIWIASLQELVKQYVNDANETDLKIRYMDTHILFLLNIFPQRL